MPELLTHALAAYVVATVLSWRYERITPAFVTLAMAGALSPDLNRVDLLVPEATVETLAGVPWSWVPLHRFGGTLLVVALGALLVSSKHRRLAFALLVLGTGSHYALDFLLSKPSGLTGPLLWPFTDHRFAVNGFYLSSDRWPAAVTTAVAVGVWLLDRRLAAPTAETPRSERAET